MWETLAVGNSINDLESLVGDRALKKGTRVRFELELKLPLAHAFDLAGAEHIFRNAMPADLRLLDVYSPDNKYKVIIEAESDSPAMVLAVLAFVKVHWVALSLISIGVFFALGFLVTSIKLKAEQLQQTIILAIVIASVTVILIVFLIARAGVRTPTIAIGA